MTAGDIKVSVLLDGCLALHWLAVFDSFATAQFFSLKVVLIRCFKTAQTSEAHLARGQIWAS